MNEQLLIYLWALLPNIKEATNVILLMTWVFSPFIIVLAIMLNINADKRSIPEQKTKKILNKINKITLTTAITSTIIYVAIPSKEELALIFLYPTIKNTTINTIQSEKLKKLNTILDTYLDKQIKQLQKNK